MSSSDEMLILFHALFLITRYVFRTVTKRILKCELSCVSPVEKQSVCNRILADIQSVADYNEEGSPVFHPPVYVQRYLAVKSVLEDVRWRGKIRKVVDFGCAEFGFFPYLKHIPGLQEILTVDIDEDLLQRCHCRVAPLNSDYLSRRTEPLDVKVLVGSISDTDESLVDCDAVICIELIEHLYPNVLEAVPHTVFGVIKPLLAVFSTPNSEFNVVFPNNTGFRHDDHKFEWNREQFECWANNIAIRYPNYHVNFQDIGPGPPGTEALGSCSQMAVFVRKFLLSADKATVELDLRNCLNERESCKNIQETGNHIRYKLLQQYSYEHCVDTRSDEMKILDEATYKVRMLSTCERFMKDDHVEVPLAVLLPSVEIWTKSIIVLRKILEDAGWDIVEEDPENVAVIYSCYCGSASSNRSEPDEVSYQRDYDRDIVEEQWDQDSTSSNNIEINSQDLWLNCEGVRKSEFSVRLDKSITGSTNELLIPCNGEQSPSCNTSRLIENLVKLHEGKEPFLVEEICNKPVESEIKIPFEGSGSQKSEYDLEDKDKRGASVQSIDSKETQTVFDDLCTGNLQGLACCTKQNYAFENRDLLPESVMQRLSLSLQNEATEAPMDSPMNDSVSVEEANDKLADSGYPNSASAQDMDMDMTPEQVEEIFTENDVLSERSDDDSDSLSSENSMDNDEMHFQPIYVPHNDVMFEAMNVENGDVANNNRDGEGNNAVPVMNLPLLEENLIPLLEAAEDINNDNEVRIPEHAEPFPHWLLNLLGIANHGGGDAINFGPAVENDNEEDEPLMPIADEGIGDEFGPGSSNSDTAASEHGSDEGLESEYDVEGLPVDPAQEVVFPGDMGAAGEPNIFRIGAG